MSAPVSPPLVVNAATATSKRPGCHTNHTTSFANESHIRLLIAVLDKFLLVGNGGHLISTVVPLHTRLEHCQISVCEL